MRCGPLGWTSSWFDGDRAERLLPPRCGARPVSVGFRASASEGRGLRGPREARDRPWPLSSLPMVAGRRKERAYYGANRRVLLC
jgi:hypothetical protein